LVLSCARLRALTVPAVLSAFVQEHEHCGGLDSGLNVDDVVDSLQGRGVHPAFPVPLIEDLWAACFIETASQSGWSRIEETRGSSRDSPASADGSPTARMLGIETARRTHRAGACTTEGSRRLRPSREGGGCRQPRAGLEKQSSWLPGTWISLNRCSLWAGDGPHRVEYRRATGPFVGRHRHSRARHRSCAEDDRAVGAEERERIARLTRLE
jgi:hypothetical protein